MKIKIGGCFGVPEQVLEVPHLEVLSDESGSPMFVIDVSRDGVSLEVVAGVAFDERGARYANRFAIHPTASNCVTLRPIKYE